MKAHFTVHIVVIGRYDGPGNSKCFSISAGIKDKIKCGKNLQKYHYHLCCHTCHHHNHHIWSQNLNILSQNIDIWSQNIDIWSQNINIWSQNIDFWSQNIDI